MTMDYNTHSVLAIIPVYDEIGKIGKVISRFSKIFIDEICIILDSPTNIIRNEIKESATSIDVPIKIIENDIRKGIGYAIRLGITHAIENNFDIIIVMAGNNKDNPIEIPKFLDAIINENYDYVQGSRFILGALHERTPILRVFLIKMYSLLWSILTKKLCTDVTNGFRAYKTKIFQNKQINIWQDWLDGYEFEFYIYYKALTLNYKTIEVPVSKIYPYNKNESYSKIHPIKNFWNILRPLVYLVLGLKK